MTIPTTANQSIITAWNTVLFDEWTDYRALVDESGIVQDAIEVDRRPRSSCAASATRARARIAARPEKSV